jgi:hypothetical protein
MATEQWMDIQFHHAVAKMQAPATVSEEDIKMKLWSANSGI